MKMQGERNIDGNCIVLDSLFVVPLNLDHEIVIQWAEVLQVGGPLGIGGPVRSHRSHSPEFELDKLQTRWIDRRI